VPIYERWERRSLEEGVGRSIRKRSARRRAGEFMLCDRKGKIEVKWGKAHLSRKAARGVEGAVPLLNFGMGRIG